MAIYEQIRDENLSLKKRSTELENIVIEKENQIRELEKKYTNIKLANALISDENQKSDAKNKVNKIVREIDKCIALLNR